MAMFGFEIMTEPRSALNYFELQRPETDSTGTSETTLVLVCTECDEGFGEVEAGDSLNDLVKLVKDHQCSDEDE